jgi:hypothetical protein
VQEDAVLVLLWIHAAVGIERVRDRAHYLDRRPVRFQIRPLAHADAVLAGARAAVGDAIAAGGAPVSPAKVESRLPRRS